MINYCSTIQEYISYVPFRVPFGLTLGSPLGIMFLVRKRRQLQQPWAGKSNLRSRKLRIPNKHIENTSSLVFIGQTLRHIVSQAVVLLF